VSKTEPPIRPTRPERARRLGAFAVHVLTASGAVWGVLALTAAADGDFVAMFVWLVVALVVDAIDGPLARAVDIERTMPGLDGTLLDLVVDYLTYVFVPAFALTRADLLPETLGLVAAGLICLTSALWWAGTEQKTEDNYFRGFPGLWNLVVFLLLMYALPAWLTFAIVVVLSAATFVGIDFVHPVRVRRLRPLTILVSILAVVLAAVVLAQDFRPPFWVEAGMTLCALYLFGIGLRRTIERRLAGGHRARS